MVAVQRPVRAPMWNRLVARAEVVARCRGEDHVARTRRTGEDGDLDDAARVVASNGRVVRRNFVKEGERDCWLYLLIEHDREYKGE